MENTKSKTQLRESSVRKARPGEVAYVAGKINGLPNYKENFNRAVKELQDLGYIVMNPADLPEGMPYEKYLPICLSMLEASDVLYMLDNWTDSKGASVEHSYGVAQGKEIHYQAG